MGRILFLIALFYIISRASAKKKQKRKDAAGTGPAASPENQAPGEGETVYRDLFDKADAKAARPGTRPNRRAGQTVQSTLTQIDASVGHHNVEASSISGHTHEETSMTGIQENCEPAPAVSARKPIAKTAAPAPAARQPLPVLNPGNVREAVVLAEILGKPKSLKR